MERYKGLSEGEVKECLQLGSTLSDGWTKNAQFLAGLKALISSGSMLYSGAKDIGKGAILLSLPLAVGAGAIIHRLGVESNKKNPREKDTKIERGMYEDAAEALRQALGKRKDTYGY